VIPKTRFSESVELVAQDVERNAIVANGGISAQKKPASRQIKFFVQSWLRGMDLNHRPLGYAPTGRGAENGEFSRSFDVFDRCVTSISAEFLRLAWLWSG
jgi:hypothetical protein